MTNTECPLSDDKIHAIDHITRVCLHCKQKVQGRDLRELMIRQGLEAELQGWRLTAKAPRCFSIIRDEYKIKGRDKLANYAAFCAIIGEQPAAFEPNPAKPGKFRRVRTEETAVA